MARPPLTVADGRFVDEPVAPAQPFQNLTQFDRLVAQYSNLPLNAALDLAKNTAPPPDEPPPPPPPTRPRATLGQSRRRGVAGYRPPRSAPEPEPEPEPDEDPPRAGSAQEASAAERHTCPDLTDVNTLDDLAGRLYRHVRTRLRTELLVDRERSGLLADPI